MCTKGFWPHWGEAAARTTRLRRPHISAELHCGKSGTVGLCELSCVLCTMFWRFIYLIISPTLLKYKVPPLTKTENIPLEKSSVPFLSEAVLWRGGAILEKPRLRATWPREWHPVSLLTFVWEEQDRRQVLRETMTPERGCSNPLYLNKGKLQQNNLLSSLFTAARGWCKHWTQRNLHKG